MVVVAFVLLLGGLAAWLGPMVVGQLGSLGSSIAAGLREIEQWLSEDLGLSRQQISGAVDRLSQGVCSNLGARASSPAPP